MLVKAAKDEDFAKSFHRLCSTAAIVVYYKIQGLSRGLIPLLPYLVLNCDVILAPFRGVEVVVVGGLLAIPWNT